MIYPKIYKDNNYQYALENAIECLYYGYGKSYWNTCNIDSKDNNQVWQKAIEILEKMQ